MLNCIVICRCLDKKPGDNIMEASSISKLLDKTTQRNRGGIFMNPNSTIGIARGVERRPLDTCISKHLESSPVEDFASVRGTSAIVAKPAFLGKPLPLCRVTGTE